MVFRFSYGYKNLYIQRIRQHAVLYLYSVPAMRPLELKLLPLRSDYSKEVIPIHALKKHIRAIMLNRTDLLKPKYNKRNRHRQQPTRVITTFNTQHDDIRKILSKHWHILYIDPLLHPFVGEKPSITYRKTKSIKDQLVQSEFTGTWRKDPCKRFGTYTCGGCRICRYMDKDNNIILPNSTRFKAHHFANCKTSGVVYMIRCSCGCFYIGKTKLEFKQRASRHLTSMRTCNPELPLGRHVSSIHGGKFPDIKFLILDRVYPNPRGGDWNKTLLQHETCWIAFLKANQPPGLNDVVSFRPFLEGFTSGEWEE